MAITQQKYSGISDQIRHQIIELAVSARTAHVGSCLSCVDILAVLYWHVLRLDPADCLAPARDRFILSKGHAGLALYVTLAERGFFSKRMLHSYAMPDSKLPEHPVYGQVPGIEVTSGSLGHGLSMALGMAYAARLQRSPGKVYVLLSDGECNEGSVWEAALLAAKHNLNNLVAIIDYNKWQATGRSDEIMQLNPLDSKWQAFGWQVSEVNGHNYQDLIDSFERQASDNRPHMVIANTIKGKGVSFMEDDNNWHYRIPGEVDLEQAALELEV